MGIESAMVRDSLDIDGGSHAAKLSFLWSWDFAELGLKTGNQATLVVIWGQAAVGRCFQGNFQDKQFFSNYP